MFHTNESLYLRVVSISQRKFCKSELKGELKATR